MSSPTDQTHPPAGDAPSTLTDADIRKVATLSRLAITDGQIPEFREKIASALGYIERLRAADLGDAEPLANPAAVHSMGTPEGNRLDEDTIGEMLPTSALMAMAPASSHEKFILVPKVLDADGGGA